MAASTQLQYFIQQLPLLGMLLAMSISLLSLVSYKQKMTDTSRQSKPSTPPSGQSQG